MLVVMNYALCAERFFALGAFDACPEFFFIRNSRNDAALKTFLKELR